MSVHSGEDGHLTGNASMGCLDLNFGEGAVLLLPLGHGLQPVIVQEGTAGRLGHPGRDAEARLAGSGDDAATDIGIDGDGQLERRLPSRDGDKATTAARGRPDQPSFRPY